MVMVRQRVVEAVAGSPERDTDLAFLGLEHTRLVETECRLKADLRKGSRRWSFRNHLKAFARDCID